MKSPMIPAKAHANRQAAFLFWATIAKAAGVIATIAPWYWEAWLAMFDVAIDVRRRNPSYKEPNS